MSKSEIEHVMGKSVLELFDRYQKNFQMAIKSETNADPDTSVYASAFIAASPAGVVAGQNDDQLKEVMRAGFEHYRQIGTKDMYIRNIRVSPIDDCHCIAHVAWTAVYARVGKPDIDIDFDVHYLVQGLGGAPKIFGWVSGDEQAVLKEHGIV